MILERIIIQSVLLNLKVLMINQQLNREVGSSENEKGYAQAILDMSAMMDKVLGQVTEPVKEEAGSHEV